VIGAVVAFIIIIISNLFLICHQIVIKEYNATHVIEPHSDVRFFAPYKYTYLLTYLLVAAEQHGSLQIAVIQRKQLVADMKEKQ